MYKPSTVGFIVLIAPAIMSNIQLRSFSLYLMTGTPVLTENKSYTCVKKNLLKSWGEGDGKQTVMWQTHTDIRHMYTFDMITTFSVRVCVCVWGGGGGGTNRQLCDNPTWANRQLCDNPTQAQNICTVLIWWVLMWCQLFISNSVWNPTSNIAKPFCAKYNTLFLFLHLLLKSQNCHEKQSNQLATSLTRQPVC